ncbi:MAG: P-loop NTPase [Lachnospiraceae bacterium]
MAEQEKKSCSSAEGCSRESCEGCPSAGNNKESFLAEMNPFSSVKKVIGIVSGKGGVGKSFVTASLASQMNKSGYSVGILDADITGPSIPKMFGVKGPAVGNDMGINPVVAKDGTRIMSLNLLVDDEEAPVVWRGPILAGTVKQFYSDVIWGDLDFLFVDMPPGTGDVPLTVFQSLPVDGIVIVTSPQELVQMIVKKAVNMAEMMNIPILGVVENYSYLKCPDCGKEIPVFGKSTIDEVAAASDMKVLGKLPLDPTFAQKADEGRFFDIENPYLQEAYEVLKHV